MTETQFKHKVEKYLEELPQSWFIKYWAGPKFTKEGIPDILACINGQFYGIELKTDNGRPTLLQIVNLRNIRAAGGIGVLLYPNDFAYFQALVERKSPLSEHWYRENIQSQKDWFEKLNK